MVSTILQTASTDAERAVLYTMLAQASTEIPEVVAMMSVPLSSLPCRTRLMVRYDAMIPRMTSVLSSTASPIIHGAISTILERAMTDGIYPSTTPNGTTTSLNNSSGPIVSGYTVGGSETSSETLNSNNDTIGVLSGPGGMPAPDVSGMALLADMGMKGLGDMSFALGKPDRYVAAGLSGTVSS